MKPLLMNAQLNKLIQQCVASQLNKDPYNKQRNKLSKKKRKRSINFKLKPILKQRSEFKTIVSLIYIQQDTKQFIN